MNQDQSSLTLEESIKEVMRTLPPIIRNYLSQGKYTEVAKSLITKYNLRIDQGGILEREMMLLLMGIENPTEFTQALAEEAKLDKKTIENIAQDINTQIFVPLREQMRSGGMNAAPPARPAAVTPAAIPTREKNYAPPLQSPTYSPPINKFPLATPAASFSSIPKRDIPSNVPISVPQKNIVRPPQSSGGINLIVSSPSKLPSKTSASNIPPGRSFMMTPPKQFDSSKRLADHEEPHIAFNKVPMPVTPSSNTIPVVSKVKPLIPESQPVRISPSVGTLPTAPKMQSVPESFATRHPEGMNRIIPPIQATPATPTIKAIVPPLQPQPISPTVPASAAPKSPVEPAKSYSIDPYREPIDEK